MRARNLKPGFFKNEELAELPFEGRLLFQGLWCMADREGKLEDRPKRLKGELFPYDDVDTEAMLKGLAAIGLIVRYEVAGKRYISIPTFLKHQKPHRNETPSCIPDPITSDQGTKQDVPRSEASTTKDVATPAESLLSESLLSESLLSESPFSGPPEGACAPPETTQALVGHYVDEHRRLGFSEPSRQRVGQAAKAIKERINAGVSPPTIAAALTLAVERAKSPAMLDLLVAEVEKPPPRRRESNADRALALVRRMEGEVRL